MFIYLHEIHLKYMRWLFIFCTILFLKIATWPQLTLNVNLNMHAALKVFCQHHIMLLYFLHLMPKLWENCNLKLYNIAYDCIYTNKNIIISLNIKHKYSFVAFNIVLQFTLIQFIIVIPKDILTLEKLLLREELKDCCNLVFPSHFDLFQVIE